MNPPIYPCDIEDYLRAESALTGRDGPFAQGEFSRVVASLVASMVSSRRDLADAFLTLSADFARAAVVVARGQRA